jgi:hypothetical protein
MKLGYLELCESWLTISSNTKMESSYKTRSQMKIWLSLLQLNMESHIIVQPLLIAGARLEIDRWTVHLLTAAGESWYSIRLKDYLYWVRHPNGDRHLTSKRSVTKATAKKRALRAFSQAQMLNFQFFFAAMAFVSMATKFFYRETRLRWLLLSTTREREETHWGMCSVKIYSSEAHNPLSLQLLMTYSV